MTDAVVRATGLVFHYPGVRALDDVSLSVPPASVTALVGPNGAGKTTLLRCLAGLERPMLGAISVTGIDVLEAPREAQRAIGHLSDFFGLYDALSVRRCLTHAAAARDVPDARINAVVSRTAEVLGIDDRLDQPCGELSRGLRQRVAIGQAIVHSPRVLLLDEPASGLDPEARHTLARLFNRLRDEGMTLIVSSHILAELDAYSTHMLVMDAGRIVEQRALAGDRHDSARIRIAWSAGGTGIEQRLDAIEGVQLIEMLEGNAALLAVSGDAPRRAQALAALIAGGVPVTHFAEERENLQDSYLRTVDRGRAAGART